MTGANSSCLKPIVHLSIEHHEFFLFSYNGRSQQEETYKTFLLPIDVDQHNISEGGEFLDDALRMKDQPLMHTEESVAAGSPEELL